MRGYKFKNANKICGISVCNPVDIERDYLLYTVDYAIKHKMNHIQFIGPIHNPVKGNVDGMTMFRKYSQFNVEKDAEFIEKTKRYVNEATEKTSANGIKSYVWHHELEVPAGFIDAYPEVLNEDGDIEVTHPIIRDFLENKIEDFFYEYPKIDGLILTLHETRIPILKLKHQKLEPVERVRYVTEILYESCKKLGKELVVRPFASIEKDYEEMLKAYESISNDLVVMDKWTQFDWSLTAPHNAFFNKVKNNPLLVETDIFGEFFGQGHLPLMLHKHIEKKIAYCENFKPLGYVSRIDRFSKDAFGTVNEINVDIMNAYMKGENVDEKIDGFFIERYPDVAKEVRNLMEATEELIIKILYLNGYFFNELSGFPSVNHSKNHFYFELMKDSYEIASDEWFVPGNWERGEMEKVLKEKDEATIEAEALLNKLEELKSRIEPQKYQDLWEKFVNLKFASLTWRELTYCFMHYTKFFETKDEFHKNSLKASADKLLSLHNEGKALLGEQFYCRKMAAIKGNTGKNIDEDIFSRRLSDTEDDGFYLIPSFVKDILTCLEIEEREYLRLSEKELMDFVICGGGFEGHRLKKEVNFSDTIISGDSIFRIPGNGLGKSWSMVNAHGWFSYELKVKPYSENIIRITAGSESDDLKLKVTVCGKEYIFDEKISGKKELLISLKEENGEETVRIRFDRTSKETPYIYFVETESK